MTAAGWHTNDHYLYALIAVVGSLAAVIGTHWFIQSSRWSGWARSLQGVAPPFINILGVLFGLTLAFLANDTWSAHDQATRAVYKEADALQSLATLAKPLPPAQRQALEHSVADYAQACVQEWAALAQRQASPAVRQKADDLLTLLASPDMAHATSNNVHALMLNKASEARDQRDQRIALSQTHVNPLKWLGMGFLGLLTLLSIAVVHVDKPRAALVAVSLFALGAAPTAAIVLIQGNPFEPPTVVSPAPIEAVAVGLVAK
ncbi:MAG: DUF4239 domain-containing protein [Burkholderiales bacterium]|nr:DUF4239 domain-containing protein [Burkholderiales bacterium]